MMERLGLAVVMVASLGCGEEVVEGIPENPTLVDVHQLVLQPACAQGGCHDVSGAGELVLTSVAASRAGLVNAESVNETAAASSILRVVPGEPDASFLMRKLTGPTLGEGLPMPIDDALTQPYVDMIERWIEQGAN
ncbi:MAG: hypothetical protein VX589_13980 [Myxococcota bacterium]|nr:hypothetical protein [Myxococcota bacterium]